MNSFIEFYKSIEFTFKIKDKNIKISFSEAAAPGAPIQQKKQVTLSKPTVIRCILAGDANVGKTAICLNYVDKYFPEQYQSTVGVQFRVITKPLGQKSFKLLIWDTAGNQKYKNITQAYYKGGKAAFFVYDVTNSASFISINDKMNEESIRCRCLVGNKADLPTRNVSTQERMTLAQQLGTDFTEISAKNQQDLQNLFMRIPAYFNEKEKN